MKKIILLIMLMVSTNIFADSIKKIVFFGDSLTDNGNLYSHDFQILPKDPPYYKGRFSNGYAWSDYLSKYYKDHFDVDTENYAVGGATAVLRNPLKGCLPLDLKNEIDDYLLRTLFQNRSDTLFIILIGANDYDSEKEQDINSLTTDVINEINADITTLINNGGKYFLIVDVPDLSKVPRVIADPTPAPRLAAVSKLHHEKALISIQRFRSQYPNLTFAFISMYEIFNDILSNTEQYNKKYHFNLTDTTTACWSGGYTIKNKPNTLDKAALNAELKAALTKNAANQKLDSEAFTQTIVNSPSLTEAYQVGKMQEKGLKPCSNPENHIFWDQLHPTTVLHELFADIVEDNLLEEGFIIDNRSKRNT